MENIINTKEIKSSIREIEKLSITSLANLSENKVRKILQEIKYSSTNSKPFCPSCGSFEKYNIKSTKSQMDKYNDGKEYISRWKCKNCNTHYSLTTDTITVSPHFLIKFSFKLYKISPFSKPYLYGDSKHQIKKGILATLNISFSLEGL